jgi:hypothetical protein
VRNPAGDPSGFLFWGGRLLRDVVPTHRFLLHLMKLIKFMINLILRYIIQVIKMINELTRIIIPGIRYHHGPYQIHQV